MKKMLYFTTKPTVANDPKSGTAEIAGIIEVDGTVKEEFHFSFDTDSLMALAQFTAKLRKYIDPYDKKDKFYPAGYNMRFQLNGLQTLFQKHGHSYLGSYLNWKAVDSLNLAHCLDFLGVLSLEDYKLPTLLERYKLNPKENDLLSEIQETRVLVRTMIGILCNKKEML
jgi:hypothetical protein